MLPKRKKALRAFLMFSSIVRVASVAPPPVAKTFTLFLSFCQYWNFSWRSLPLSSISILEICVIPILLYGSENWIMTESLMKKLRKVGKKNSQMAKTSLKYSCHSCSCSVHTSCSCSSPMSSLVVRSYPLFTMHTFTNR